MSQARVARIAGISLAALWLITAMLAAASMQTPELAATPAKAGKALPLPDAFRRYLTQEDARLD
jgi:hypothetical protein